MLTKSKRALQTAIRKATKPCRRVFNNPIISHLKTAVKVIAFLVILGTVGALELGNITCREAGIQTLIALMALGVSL